MGLFDIFTNKNAQGAVEIVRGTSKRTFGELLKPGRCHVRK